MENQLEVAACTGPGLERSEVDFSSARERSYRHSMCAGTLEVFEVSRDQVNLDFAVDEVTGAWACEHDHGQGRACAGIYDHSMAGCQAAQLDRLAQLYAVCPALGSSEAVGRRLDANFKEGMAHSLSLSGLGGLFNVEDPMHFALQTPCGI